jgi:hypothetical protein
MNRHHVAFGEQVWTELQVIVKVERPSRLEALTEVRYCNRLFIFPYVPVLFV